MFLCLNKAHKGACPYTVGGSPSTRNGRGVLISPVHIDTPGFRWEFVRKEGIAISDYQVLTIVLMFLEIIVLLVVALINRK